MEKKAIKKSIDIDAPKEKVWEVLTNDKYTRAWYAEFSEGTHAETDWKIGSKAVFKDNSNSGLVAKIIDNKPNEVISIEYEGVVGEDGIEDYDSDMAKEIKGGRETYLLSEQQGVTHLLISCDMSEDFFEPMSLAWDKAIVKIQQLADTI